MSNAVPTELQEAHVWLDDLRPLPDWFTHLAISSQAAITLLTEFSLTPEIEFKSISFDHDLGGDDTSRRVMIWMIDNDFWPESISFHTANPVGRAWLVGMAQRYAPDQVRIGR